MILTYEKLISKIAYLANFECLRSVCISRIIAIAHTQTHHIIHGIQLFFDLLTCWAFVFIRDNKFKFCFLTIKGHEKNVRGHSTTTLTKFYPILITYPPWTPPRTPSPSSSPKILVPHFYQHDKLVSLPTSSCPLSYWMFVCLARILFFEVMFSCFFEL